MWKSTLTRAAAVSLIATGLLFGISEPAYAHAFGQRYDLPLPLNLYLAGAAIAVVLSFVVISIAAQAVAQPTLPRLESKALGRIFASPVVRVPLRLATVGLLGLTLASGFIGTQRPLQNFAPTFVWVVFWVGLAFISALVGNLWAALNPWSALFEWAEALYQTVTGRQSLSWIPYPESLGVWPAALLMLGFSWLELVWREAQIPWNTSGAVLLYSVVTWLGMLVYGRAAWLAHGEVFTLVFGLFSNLAPCRLDTKDGETVLVVQPYASEFTRLKAPDASQLVFVLMLLAILSFDGFKDTPLWQSIVEVALPPLLPLLGNQAYAALNTLALVTVPALFVGIYFSFAALMHRVAGKQLLTCGQTARTFVFTLVPIVIAYHLSHYLSYLLVIGQQIIPLISDPFGFGWNLFGTADYRISVGVIGARFVWRFAVIAIVVGHVISVALSHLTAVKTYPSLAVAQRSQYPMLALMVGYTLLSLWLFAQPIMEG
ncbi:MAG: hypothetical protein ACFB5Z_12915 [Elainellaceae cyanobacterium]